MNAQQAGQEFIKQGDAMIIQRVTMFQFVMAIVGLVVFLVIFSGIIMPLLGFVLGYYLAYNKNGIHIYKRWIAQVSVSFWTLLAAPKVYHPNKSWDVYYKENRK